MSSRRNPITIVFALCALHSVTHAISPCAGEGPRYGDYKCNHDPTHRVCAQLKDADGSKINWGSQNFWQLTHQYDWSSQVGSDANNPGGGWCICMWATASLIEQVGCDNVHLDCSSTDVSYVMASYTDGGQDLSAAKSCLQTKCLSSAPTPASSPSSTPETPTAVQSVEQLHAQYSTIFHTGNRNAASHLWSSFLFGQAATMSQDMLVRLGAGYCPISGSPVNPSAAKRYQLALPRVGSGEPVSGFLYFCCWPCACDARDYLYVDTKSITTLHGAREYLVAVIGNPCTNPSQLEKPFASATGQTTTLQAEAPELVCQDGQLRGATLSDNGFVILSLFYEAVGTPGVGSSTAVVPSHGSNSVASMKDTCEERAQQGFQGGMGRIFRELASIFPVGASIATARESSTASTTEDSGDAPDAPRQQESNSSLLFAGVAVTALVVLAVSAMAVHRMWKADSGPTSSVDAPEGAPPKWVPLDEQTSLQTVAVDS